MQFLFLKHEVSHCRNFTKEYKMAKIRITQIKSIIDRPARQKKTMEALGLRKMNSSVEKDETPQIKGMVDAVKHLVKIEVL